MQKNPQKLSEAERILVELLRVESISGNERKVAERIEKELTGFRIKRQRVAKDQFNIIARKGRSDIWIVAHMDTVPPFFPPRITAGKIFGRGAADNKGNIAGAIVAARSMKDINLLFTVDEERDFAGARKANIKGRAVILEPTGFKKRFSQCGVVDVRIAAKGQRKHSSLLRDDDDNALHVLTKILEQLRKKRWHRFNVGVIHGGIAGNIVADCAEAVVSARPRDSREFSEIIKTLRGIKGVNVKIAGKMPPFQSHLAAGKADADPVAFFSELSFFKKGVLFGAGNITEAHSEHEFILRRDLRRLPGALMELVRELK